MFGTLALAIVAPIAATLIQLAISRAREYQADATGARIAGRPSGLASALEKMEMASGMARMEPVPATAHLYIVNPLRGAGWRACSRLTRRSRSGWPASARWRPSDGSGGSAPAAPSPRRSAGPHRRSRDPQVLR